EATLTWTDADHATGYYVWMRNVTAGENAFTKLPYPVSGGSWSASSLLNGGEYEFKLQSVNGMIEGGTTGAVSVRPTGPAPAAPTGLSATAGDHNARLTWNTSAHATGYFVLVRNVTAGESGFTKLPFPVSGSSWTYGNMVNGATYQIKLQAVNGLIEGSTTAAVSVTPTGPTPAAPTGLTARAADRGVVLTWNMPAHASCVSILQRNVTAGESDFTRFPYPVCDDTFTISSLVNGATYQYKVQAYNDLIAGGTTGAVSAVPTGPAPPGPESLTVSSRNGKAILYWNAASRATSYYIWARRVSPNPESWTRLQFGVSGSTFTVGSLINGATYEFRVQSVDGLQPGGYSNTVSVVPLGPTPQAPGNLAASGSWRGTATLTWSNTSTAGGYFIYVSDNGSAWTRLPFAVSSDPWTASALTPGHTYRFQLRAVNGYQEGNYSNVASVTIPLPPKVTGLGAQQYGPYKSRITWNSVSGADGYNIYYAVNAPGNHSTPTSWRRYTYPVTGNRFTAEYLITPGVYFYKVAAVKNGVEGPASTPASMSPLMENRAHYEARAAYLVYRASGAYSSTLIQGGGGGSDSDLFMARAPILNLDWFSDLIGDGRNFSDEIFASSRVSFVWEPRSGKIGAMAYPSCPLAFACKDALKFQQTGTSIPWGTECDHVATICGGSYSYNKIGASGGGGAVYVGFQFANSLNTVAGIGIPGAIDGTLNVAQQGRSFRATLRADMYPSWEFLRIPHYTTNGMNSVLFFGGRRQKTIEYLCSRCHGQSTVTYQG
ncbi:fibronectin type III domain-containing protein, partial [Actinomadura livida]